MDSAANTVFKPCIGYHNCIDLVKTDVWKEGRFVKFSERKMESAMPYEGTKTLHHGKYQMVWCGVPIMKGALELTTYQQLLQLVRPATIFEIGAWQGSSAAWFGDMCKMFDLKTHVYSIDIDLTLLDERAKGRDNVTFLQGDCLKIEETFTPQLLKQCPHPWFVCEDAHVNIVGVLEYFSSWMEPGDYISVEDTSPDICSEIGMGLIESLGYEHFGDAKLKELNNFMERNGEKFVVDRYYTDFFGYNGTGNWNSYLKRI